MSLDLPFGFHHETEAHAITQATSQQANPKSARIPEWIEQGWAVAEFAEPLGGPGEMIRFLAGCSLEVFAQSRIAG